MTETTEFNESEVTAKELLGDDRFILGGLMYQIDTVVVNPQYEDNPHGIPLTNIGFFPVENRDGGRHSLLIVPSDTKFKIFNQKPPWTKQ